MSRLARLGFIDARHTTDPVRRKVRSRGVPPALDGHEVFYCEDPVEASDLMAKAFAPNRLSVTDADGFVASMHGIRMRDVSLLHLDLHLAAVLDIPSCGAYYAVHMPTNSRTFGAVHGIAFEANATNALVTNPGDPLHLNFEFDAPQLIVRIEQRALERHLARMTGRTPTHPLVFEPEMNLTSDAATRWHGALQLLHTEVSYTASMVHRGIGIGPLEDLLMSTLLLLQPSNHLEQLTRPAGTAGRRSVRRALDYLEEHLSEDIRMDEIAEHVGASVRSIQQGFHDELGLTPMAYLRDRRLECARAELADAAPEDGLTVTDVAEHWGFHHLGSFAMVYRKRWGESPSHTLRN